MGNHIQHTATQVNMRLIDLMVFGFIDSFHSVSLKEDYDEIINELCGTSVEAETTKAWNRFSDINSLKVTENNYWNHLDEFVKRQDVINHEWSRINEKINDIKNEKIDNWLFEQDNFNSTSFAEELSYFETEVTDEIYREILNSKKCNRYFNRTLDAKTGISNELLSKSFEYLKFTDQVEVEEEPFYEIMMAPTASPPPPPSWLQQALDKKSIVKVDDSMKKRLIQSNANLKNQKLIRNSLFGPIFDPDVGANPSAFGRKDHRSDFANFPVVKWGLSKNHTYPELDAPLSEDEF